MCPKAPQEELGDAKYRGLQITAGCGRGDLFAPSPFCSHIAAAVHSYGSALGSLGRKIPPSNSGVFLPLFFSTLAGAEPTCPCALRLAGCGAGAHPGFGAPAWGRWVNRAGAGRGHPAAPRAASLGFCWHPCPGGAWGWGCPIQHLQPPCAHPKAPSPLQLLELWIEPGPLAAPSPASQGPENHREQDPGFSEAE